MKDDREPSASTVSSKIRPETATKLKVSRKIYRQDELNKDADYHRPHPTFKKSLRKTIRNCGFYDCIKHSMPILFWLPKYDVRQYLLKDIIAGVTVAIMHIPQGMGYAMLSEAPPIVGLYMAFFPVLIYVIFGDSPHISIGTFAVACLMSGKIVQKHAYHPYGNETLWVPTSPSDKSHISNIQVLSVLSFLIGATQMLMWIMRMGALSSLLSDPLVSGFTTASAVHVVASQVSVVLGLQIKDSHGHYSIIKIIIEVGKNISKMNWLSVLTTATAVGILILNNKTKKLVKRYCKIPVPAELLMIILFTLVSRFCDFQGRFGVALIGNIPTGLPEPMVPNMELIELIWLDALVITLVTYTVTMSMAIIFANKEKYEVDPNQELLALGMSNVVGAIFGCSPVCASLSRSTIQYEAGAKSGITSVVSASLILCVLLLIGPFFEDLPRCVLSGIIIIALRKMCTQVTDLVKFWRLSKLDGVVWLATFSVCVIVGIDWGLYVGLGSSLASLYIRAQQPYVCLLGRVAHTDLYLDIKRYRAAQEFPGMKIFHYCGGLNFATKNMFRIRLLRKVGCLQAPPHVVVAEAEELEQVIDEESPQYDYDWNPDDPQNDLKQKEQEPNNTEGGSQNDVDKETQNRLHAKSLSISLNKIAAFGKNASGQLSASTPPVKCVIIDLTALSYVDAPGVKMLVSLKDELINHYDMETVIMAGTNGPVLEMIARHNHLERDKLQIETFPTVHDAVTCYLSQKKKQEALQQQLERPLE